MTTKKEAEKISEAQKINTIDDQVSFLVKHRLELEPHKKALRQLINRINKAPYHKMKMPELYKDKNGTYLREEYQLRIEQLKEFRKLWIKEVYSAESRVEGVADVTWKRINYSFRNHPEECVRGSVEDLIRSIDKTIIAHEENKPDKNRGNKPEASFDMFVTLLKEFWIEVLKHNNFFYDQGKQHADRANDFVDDFVLAEFRGKNVTAIRGLRMTLAHCSDARKVK